MGEFDWETKPGFNWGGGVELMFPTNWATGISIHGAHFEHQRILYDAWGHSRRLVDWDFIRVNWYGRYSLGKKRIIPFLQGGIGLYYLEGRNTYGGGNQKLSQTTGLSLVPGLGLEYGKRRFSIFVQTDYNFVFRESIEGDVIRNVVRQFFDLFLGVKFYISNR